MQQHIRNFCVISHIDHGKTTLTDRILELSDTCSSLKLQDRMLDSNPIEKARGITIKLAPVRINYTQNAKRYTLNLIDTPGHVDFTYEVSRSLAACEGALLLVDATQGIQAQTIANAYLAIEQNLTIIPVINKIDLPSANVSAITKDLCDTFGFKPAEIISISAKTGKNIDQLLKDIITRIPAPANNSSKTLRALVFNSFFSQHQGVIASVRLVDGTITSNDQLHLIASKSNFAPKEIGVFTPKLEPTQTLKSGEVGYIATGLKNVDLVKPGDTVIHPPRATSHAPQALSGYQEPKPVVFMELYPIDGKDFSSLKDAIYKLKLNDAALSITTTSSPALGHGFKVGYLGLLHAEVVSDRLKQEFNLELIATTPTVKHLVTLTTGNTITINSATDMPDPNQITKLQEPYVIATIFTPANYLGEVIQVANQHRAKLLDQDHFGQRVRLHYSMPLSELISGFWDKLKSASSGFASLDYELKDFMGVDAVKLDILINKEIIAPLSSIVVKSKAEATGRRIVDKLKEILPRQQFEVPIQAAIGGTIVARATLKALRKDVTAKLYGGDQTRKDKLLKKQKKGKKIRSQFSKVNIPQEAFLAVLKK